MKVINYNEPRHYFEDEDRKEVLEHLTYNNNISWLWQTLGYKSHTTWYRKFNCYNNAYFTQVEVDSLEKLLKIKFERH